MSKTQSALVAVFFVCSVANAASAQEFSYKTAHNFYTSKHGGLGPQGNLVSLHNQLYGATAFGGKDNCGVIFQYDPTNNETKTLVSFAKATGCSPSDLTHFGDKLYAPSQSGGAENNGTVTEYDLKTGRYRLIYDFKHPGDPALPESLIAVDGILYGTALNGGASGEGAVFSIDTAPRKMSVIHSFSDGYPAPGLVYLDNTLWGAFGYAADNGVFKIDLSTNAFSTVYSFPTQYEDPTFLTYGHGLLLGGTSQGGTANAGVIFTIDPRTGKEHTLFSLDGQSQGAAIQYPPIFAGDYILGTDASGGENGNGVIFALSKAGTFNVIENFDPSKHNPLGVLEHLNGDYFGTTAESEDKLGGTAGGVLFRLTPP